MAASTTVIDLIFNGVDKTGAASAAVLKNLENFSKGAKDLTPSPQTPKNQDIQGDRAA